MKIQSLEQGLPGTAQMKLLIGGFEAEPLLAYWIQAVTPLMANRVQVVAPLVASSTCGSLNISKTQGEREIKLKIDQIKVKIDELTVKKEYKSKIV